MIQSLDQDEGKTQAAVPVGNRIASIAIDGNDQICVIFMDRTGLKFWDDGQSCCELRHASTDDDLASFVGAEYRGVELREMPEINDSGGESHDCEALLIHTSLGDVTIVNHNEHNGYYAGFDLCVETIEKGT